MTKRWSTYRTICILLAAIIFGTGAKALTIHRALVIGIGRYEDGNWSKINGDNDARYVVSMLEQLGYTDIKSLKNEQATKKNIIAELESLAKRSKPGDNIYIHYSGHGQLMTDLNGDESVRWTNWHAQWDESLVPYDAYMTYCGQDRGEKHISDDELAIYLTKIRNAVGRKGEIIVVIDACHSGDATRGEMDEVVRGVDTKFNIPKRGGTAVSDPIPEQWLTISACQPYQLCTEIKDKRVGKLTYALFKLRKSIFRQGRRDMERALANFIKRYETRLPQTPMVTGKK